MIRDYIRFTDPFRNHKTITVESFWAEYGFEPHQFVDYHALVGDTGDNIPGVRGIGPIRAKALVQEHGSLGVMLSQINGKDINKVITYKEDAKISRQLFQLVNVAQLKPESGEYKKEWFYQVADIVRG